MIKKFISKLLGKADQGGGRSVRGKRVEVPKSDHGIDPRLVDERAVKVVSTLATPATRPTSWAGRCATCCSA